MTSSQSDPTPAAAATALAWLVDMGADEILLDQPVNRLLTPPVREVKPPPAARQFLRPTPVQPPPAPAAWKATEAAGDLQAEAAQRAASCNTLQELRAALTSFESHPLRKTASSLCLNGGAEQSRILVLCDRPRTEEDRSGDVLAGKHQVLAERMLAAIGLCSFEARERTEQVMLANIIPWRPPGNRAPTELETSLCLHFARRLIDIIQPQIILCFSALPGQLLAGGEESIQKARGKWLSIADGSIPLITTFHPETLLKSPGSKRLAWHDLQAFREKLESL
jgi:uracil-DNA glycosylase